MTTWWSLALPLILLTNFASENPYLRMDEGVSAQGKGSLSATGNLGISGTVTPQLSNFIRDCLTPECIRNGGVNLLQKIVFQKGHIQTGNKIYHLGMEKVSFCQAMKKCNDLSMKLSTIENKSENEAVLKYLTKKGVTTPVWISANKCYGTKWSALDGKELSYFNWSPNEPQGKGYCVGVTDSNDSLEWKELPCRNQLQYVCERYQLEGECESKEMKNHEAVEYCKRRAGSKLLEILDKEKLDTVFQAMNEKGISDGNRYWTAISNFNHTDWRIPSGEKVTILPWDRSEPNDRRRNVKVCLEIVRRGDTIKYNDQNCFTNRRVACERDKPVVQIFVNGDLPVSIESQHDPKTYNCNVVVTKT